MTSQPLCVGSQTSPQGPVTSAVRGNPYRSSWTPDFTWRAGGHALLFCDREAGVSIEDAHMFDSSRKQEGLEGLQAGGDQFSLPCTQRVCSSFPLVPEKTVCVWGGWGVPGSTVNCAICRKSEKYLHVRHTRLKSSSNKWLKRLHLRSGITDGRGPEFKVTLPLVSCVILGTVFLRFVIIITLVIDMNGHVPIASWMQAPSQLLSWDVLLRWGGGGAFLEIVKRSLYIFSVSRLSSRLHVYQHGRVPRSSGEVFRHQQQLRGCLDNGTINQHNSYPSIELGVCILGSFSL